MKKFLHIVFVFLAVAGLCSAQEPVDLGRGLTYLRVGNFSADGATLAAQVSTNRPLVIDFRGATAAAEEAAEFSAALTRRAGSLPLMILVGPDTPATLASVLAKLPAGALTLGIRSAQPSPNLVIEQTEEADRRAYAAWQNGTTMEALIDGKLEKSRFDEAALVKEFQSGHGAVTPPPAPDPTAKPEVALPALADRVLQRAVHLHRALIALRPR